MCIIRSDNSNSKLIKYQHGHMFYLYAISIALKLTQFGTSADKADSRVVEYLMTCTGGLWFEPDMETFDLFSFLPFGFPG